MMHFLLRFVILAVAIWIISFALPGMKLKNFKSALVVGGVYSLLNWLLFKVFIFITFPLVALKYLTLGIVGVLINAVLLMITDKMMDDFELSGFGTAIFAALGISLANIVLTAIFF